MTLYRKFDVVVCVVFMREGVLTGINVVSGHCHGDLRHEHSRYALWTCRHDIDTKLWPGNVTV